MKNKIVWPEKKERLDRDYTPFTNSEIKGWNSCHDAFMSIINSTKITGNPGKIGMTNNNNDSLISIDLEHRKNVYDMVVNSMNEEGETPNDIAWQAGYKAGRNSCIHTSPITTTGGILCDKCNKLVKEEASTPTTPNQTLEPK